jgi:hypothetical protein
MDGVLVRRIRVASADDRTVETQLQLRDESRRLESHPDGEHRDRQPRAEHLQNPPQRTLTINQGQKGDHDDRPTDCEEDEWHRADSRDATPELRI